jgi:hypothetical protein
VESRDPIRGRFRSPEFRRLSHGLLLPRLSTVEAESSEEKLRDLKAWRLVLPPDAVFTHVTAAWLFDWWLPRLPEHVPTFAATAADARPRRAGLVCSRLEVVAANLVRYALPVDAPGEVLLRAARDLAVLDLVVLIDCALAKRDVTRNELEILANSRRPGCRRLRAALAMSDARSESAWESLLRVFHEIAQIPVDPQAAVVDQNGSFVARADLLVIQTGDLHEYDGAHHDRPAQRTQDLRRLRRIQEANRVRRGFTAPDLVVSPGVTMHELDRVLGRPHDPRRIEVWTTYLQESCLTAKGRLRLQNRWLATRHWSQTPA